MTRGFQWKPLCFPRVEVITPTAIRKRRTTTEANMGPYADTAWSMLHVGSEPVGFVVFHLRPNSRNASAA